MTREYREYAKSRIEYLLKISRLDERDKEALEAAIQALSQVSEIEENIIKYMKKYPNHVGNTDFWEGFYACRNVVLQLDDEEYSPKEQEPCDDAISREDVIKLVECSGYDLQFRTDNADMCDDVRKLPSVTQKPKTGHWIPIYQGDEIINYRCSECELGDTNGSTNLYGWDYCRRCGARMVEPQEKRCEDCNHYGKLSLDCARCDDDCSMYEPQESEVKDGNN